MDTARASCQLETATPIPPWIMIGSVGAKGHLCHRQAAGDQGVAESIGVSGIVHHDHRHQPQAAELFENFVHFPLSPS